MRDNGLTAAAYTSLGGIDPLVADPVLTALAEAGIAAYSAMAGESRTTEASDSGTAESADQAGTATETTDKPDAPAKADEVGKVPAGFEEIFVDSEAVERARPVIERSTEDAEWKSLIEQFNAPSAPGHDGGESLVPRWPASEDVDEKYEPLIDVPASMTVEDTSDDDEDEDQPAKKADDPHDHFVPPEPERGPRLDWISRIAWLGLIGGPLLLIAAAVFDFGTGRITTLAVVGFIGGFLTLVIRMKDRLPPDDTPDDGAVV